MKTRISILLSLIIISCNLQVPVEEPDKTVIITEIITREIIMNDFIVKPFQTYPAYYQSGNNVFGVPLNSKGPADLVKIVPEIIIEGETLKYRFNEFFVEDGKPYFKIIVSFSNTKDDPEIITKCYTLESGDAIEVLSDFPAVPDQIRVTGDFNNYKIIIDTYKDSDINVLTRYLSRDPEKADYTEILIFVDGFIEIEGGLLIHAKEGRGSSRPAGLLFWPDPVIKDGVIIQQNGIMNHWKEPGRFWK